VPYRFYLNLVRARGHTYARLARSRREGDRVRTEILANLGPVSPVQVAALRAWLESNPLLPGAPTTLLTDIARFSTRRTWQYGRVALGHALWRKLGLHEVVVEVLNGVPHKARCAQLIETMVLNRLDDPTSKYGLIEWLDDSAIPFLLGYRTDGLHDNLFYRAMDRLWARRDTLERRVYERVVRPTTHAPGVLYHDLTSSYYEGEGGPLAQFGYSRDHRGDRPQIAWGMVVTPEGLPITIQVYPGNTTDNTTVVRMRERLTDVFGLKGGIYVGDRGMKTEPVLQDLTAHGLHYVLAEVNRNVEEILREAPKHKAVTVTEQNVAREVIGRDGRRYVVLFNAERRQQELETLDHRVAQATAILDQFRQNLRKGREWHHHVVLRRVQAALNAKGLGDLFEVDWDEETVLGLTAKLKAKVARRKREAGWWVLSTDTNLPIVEVARLYMGLAIIEHGWREIKSVLEVRPLRHRLTRRVEAHLVICTLAYLLQQALEIQVRAEGLTGSRAFERFRSMVLNENEVAGARVRFFSITRPTVEQEAILAAAGIDAGRFQRGWERLGRLESV
jgi:transposase